MIIRPDHYPEYDQDEGESDREARLAEWWDRRMQRDALAEDEADGRRDLALQDAEERA